MVTTAYIGLGSNQGFRLRHLREALKELSGQEGVRFQRASRVYETSPWGVEGQKSYLNAVAKLSTSLKPRAFLKLLQRIEKSHGRKRHRQWEARPLDLDILFFGGRIIRAKELTVPHPRIPERRFVLEPLSEIAPHLRHPTLKKSVQSLAQALQDPAQKVKDLKEPLAYGLS